MRDTFNRIFNGKGSIRAFLCDGIGVVCLFSIGGALFIIGNALGF